MQVFRLQTKDYKYCNEVCKDFVMEIKRNSKSGLKVIKMYQNYASTYKGKRDLESKFLDLKLRATSIAVKFAKIL